jgi:hypothetical protein
VRSKLFWELCLGLLGTLATGLVSAGAVTEYTSLASWTAGVNHVSAYQFSGATGELAPFNSVVFGPGTFTTGQGFGVIFNDGQYGSGVQYIADNPQAFGGGPQTPSVIATFGASADVTALAFTLGANSLASTIDISVNGSALAPVAVSAAFPTTFFAVTDTSGPITNITFSALNNIEMDVINSYASASAVAAAPEIDAASGTSALALLLGGLAMIHARKRV